MKNPMVMVVMVAAAGWVAEADAGTATSNMLVTAEVTSACTISAGALAFGAYDTTSATSTAGTAALSVTCTKGAITSITLGQGTHAAGGSTDLLPIRRMQTAGGSFLSYGLYSDATRLLPWTNTALTGVVHIAASSAPATVTVYGSISALQDVPAGAYGDTVVATITF